MKINTKLLKFFQDKGISHVQIAESYGGTRQGVWNMLNNKNGKVPLDFLIWLAEHHPEVNINALLHSDGTESIVQESASNYEKRPATKAQIVAEIAKVLDKYL